MGQADKAQALIHQTWLEYGPSAAAVRQANVCVRQCLTDMGVEANVIDLPDLVNHAVPSVTVGAPMAANKYLFPLALSIPGGQHILDNALQTALIATKWWPEWQRQAKVFVQWLAPTSRRDFLAERVKNANLAKDISKQRTVKALTLSFNRFAKWR